MRQGEYLAVVETQRRHIPFGVELIVILTARGLARSAVELGEFVREAAFVQDDVGGERAGARHVIQIHVDSFPGRTMPPPNGGESGLHYHLVMTFGDGSCEVGCLNRRRFPAAAIAAAFRHGRRGNSIAAPETT